MSIGLIAQLVSISVIEGMLQIMMSLILRQISCLRAQGSTLYSLPSSIIRTNNLISILGVLGALFQELGFVTDPLDLVGRFLAIIAPKFFRVFAISAQVSAFQEVVEEVISINKSVSIKVAQALVQVDVVIKVITLEQTPYINYRQSGLSLQNATNLSIEVARCYSTSQQIEAFFCQAQSIY